MKTVGVKLIGRVEIIHNGKIAYNEVTRDGWKRKYDTWRCKWCFRHIDSWTPIGFREGKINPLTLLFTLTQIRR